MRSPLVSIIIPLHNEATRLRETVCKVIRYGERELLHRYEIVLVENGSTDETYKLACEFSATYRPVRAFQVATRSKAQAVRFGMIAATGDYRYMCDCDLSTPIEELTYFLRYMRDGWDIVIGSREHKDSRVETSFKRWFIGRVFQKAVQSFTGLEYPDTQCGFKLFNASAANTIFPLVECTSMAFDVEVLYLARQLGYYCMDMPITWENDNDSRVRILRDSWLMLNDLARIKRLHQNIVPTWKTKKIPA